jgi:hypothetical protein
VRSADFSPVAKAVLTVVNEYCQVMAQFFTRTVSLLEVRRGLSQLPARYKADEVSADKFHEIIWRGV